MKKNKIIGPISKTPLVVNLLGSPGTGKCFGAGTKILMFDGKIKNIEDIKIGDCVMGDDSTPRTVLDLHRGKSKMYKININKLGNLIVSENHILCITRQKVNGKKKTRTRVYEDISIEDFINNSNNYKTKSKMYQNVVEYSKKELKINPYYLGLWLGDGLSEQINRICIADDEILDFCKKYANELGLFFTQQSHNRTNNCNIYSISGGEKAAGNNILCKYGKEYNLAKNKHIPIEYLTGSREQRLQLLAGLLDTDGYLGCNYYSIVQKSNILSEEICRLCNSLGFRATTKKINKSCQNGFTGIYNEISISGQNLSEIPCLVKRKKVYSQNSKCNPLHHGFTIEEIGEGDYYGIETDGNGRFLLDNCLVVHNSTGAAYIFAALKMAGINAELVTEFAKDKAWEHNLKAVNNQAYVFGKQCYRMSRCADEVDVIITDSPLFLSIIYNKDPRLTENFNRSVMDTFNSYNNINFLLKRVKGYNPKGRFQTEEESNQIGNIILMALTEYNIPYDVISADENGYGIIIEKIKLKLREIKD